MNLVEQEAPRLGDFPRLRKALVTGAKTPGAARLLLPLLLIANVFWLVLSSALLWAWATSLVPYSTAWGDVATWATAVVTAGGLIFAGLTIQNQTRQSRKAEEQRAEGEIERRRSAARAVGFKVRWEPATKNVRGYTRSIWGARIEVQNMGPYPVTEMTFKFDPPLEDAPHGLLAGTVLQGTTVEEFRKLNHLEKHSAQFPEDFPKITMLFTDAWDQRWSVQDVSLPGRGGPRGLQAVSHEANPFLELDINY